MLGLLAPYSLHARFATEEALINDATYASWVLCRAIQLYLRSDAVGEKFLRSLSFGLDRLVARGRDTN